MNKINENKRLKDAAAERAEGEKVVTIKQAEAAAEANYLNGYGIARQRKAIVDGFKDSVNDFAEGVEGTTTKDVVNMIMVTQYMDMMKDVGKHNQNTLQMMPFSKNPNINM